MKNIDFLPDIYRQRSAQRHARMWWVAVVIIFGAAIGATATVQVALRRNVQRQLDELLPQYLAAQQRDNQLALLNARIAEHAQEAALYTYLQHPWPRSQVLKAIVAPLPEAVRLAEVRLTEHAEAQVSSAVVPVAVPSTAVPVKKSPAEADLEQLREQQDRMRVTLEVIGFAKDVSALHRYVDQFSQAPFIASAQLKSLEAVAIEGQLPQTRFEVHLVLRPGHGQVGGPVPTINVALSDTASAGGNAP